MGARIDSRVGGSGVGAVLATVLGAIVLGSGPIACGGAEEPTAAEVARTAAPQAGTGAARAVLISIDTLRNDYVGRSVSGRAVTPRLDALAARGVRFSTAVSPIPITLPSHATMLTGLDPIRHGVRVNAIFQLDAAIPTIAEAFQEEGIATGAVVGARVLDRRYGLDAGFDHYDDQMGFRRAFGNAGYAERPANEVVDAALEWLEPRPERFFLWVHMYDPHLKLNPPRRFRYEFPEDLYAAEIHFSDEEVGRLIDAIEQAYPDGRTLYVVTSDHGESMGEHGDPTHSYTIYEATQRVPLILAGPGVPAGGARETVVRLADLAPTLAEAMGVPFEGDLDGRSLMPLLDDAAAADEAPRTAWVETIATRLEYGWSPLYGVRNERFKYIRAPRPELYAIESDPDELVDLSAELPDVVRSLDAEIEARLARAVPLVAGDAPSADERRQLEALGYVIPLDTQFPADTTVVGGPDPKDHVQALGAIARSIELSLDQEHAEALAAVEAIEGEGHHLVTYRARYARLAEQHEKAERYARQLVEEAPSWADGQLELGLVLTATGRGEEAMPHLLEAARLEPHRSDAPLTLAVLAMRVEDFDRATTHLETAYAARDQNAEVLWRLAAMRALAGRADEADALIAELPRPRRSDPEVIQNLVAGHVRAGDPERALRTVRTALRARPRSEPLRKLRDELLVVTAESDDAASPDAPQQSSSP